MVVTSQTRNSALYTTLSDLGMLCSEEKYIRMIREESESDSYFETYPLSNGDINGVSYLNSWLAIDDPSKKDKLEIWIDDQYQNPAKIQWIEHGPYLCAVTSGQYDPSTSIAKAFYNPGILHRYYKSHTDNTQRTYTFTIDIRKFPYNNLEYPDRAAYFIANNQVKTPEVKWLDQYQIQFTARYTTDIDFIITSNLVGIYHAKKGVGFLIDNPNSNVCYHHIIVDFDPSYHIDARFYPMICVDKDCIVRVYSDSYHEIKYPEVQRLINYPEYAQVTDPYNTNYEYLRTLKEIDDVIVASDSTYTILQKFHRIIRFCYRIWEKFPRFPDEQSDFMICDNHEFGNPTFVKGIVYLQNSSGEVLYSKVPYEPHRDLLFYEGVPFHTFAVQPLTTTTDGKVVWSASGPKRYIISTEYDPNKFTLIKFNAWEDTNIVNVGDYIDPNMTIQLHRKMNRFYRNLMVVRGQILDKLNLDYARIMTEEPSAHDDYLWFELLTNAQPEEFSNNPDLTIHLYGLNGQYIPKDVVKGAYMLELDPDDGPAQYKDILTTFYDLSEEQKKYLVLQYSSMGEDPGAKVYYNITVGKESDITDPSRGLLIEDPETSPPYKEEVITVGKAEEPPEGDYIQGDLYAQVGSIDGLLDELAAGSNRDAKIDAISSFMDEELSFDQIPDQTLDQILTDINNINEQITLHNNTPNVLSELSDDEIIQHNVKYIISDDEPESPDLNDMWIQATNIPPAEYYRNIVSIRLQECAAAMLSNPVYDDSSADIIKTDMVFDYGANSDPNDTRIPEIFRKVTDPTLHPIYTEQPENPNDMDIWFEYLDEINDTVCYYDEETMVLRVDERFVAIRFGDDNLEAFLFDDIFMNFDDQYGIKYLSILADLVNSGVISQSKLMIFHNRLITDLDRFDLELRRLYLGTSYVVSTTYTGDANALAVGYSSNMKRFTMDYATASMREQEAAYKHCINYQDRDFAFLPDRMLLFVNGIYIPRDSFHEEFPYRIQLENFDQIIRTVDILYSERDEELMSIKKSAYAYWPLSDQSEMIQRPERNYAKMELIDIYQKSYVGYYDLLLKEYILNGKLERILDYLKDHPDEADDFIRDIVHQFYMISDLHFTPGIEADDNPRIVIPAFTSGGEAKYEIKEG